LVFHSSTIAMMHGPTNIRFVTSVRGGHCDYLSPPQKRGYATDGEQHGQCLIFQIRPTQILARENSWWYSVPTGSLSTKTIFQYSFYVKLFTSTPRERR